MSPQRAALSVRSWLSQDGAVDRVDVEAAHRFPAAGDGCQPRIAALIVDSKGETVRAEPGSPFPQ